MQPNKWSDWNRIGAKFSGPCSNASDETRRSYDGSCREQAYQSSHFLGKSSVGFLSKKPDGMRWKPVYSTGMTGQSSGRGTWVSPTVCQTTRSQSSILRFSAVISASPPCPACITVFGPAALNSPSLKGVAHKLWLANAARAATWEPACANNVGEAAGSSLYATGTPHLFFDAEFTTFQFRLTWGALSLIASDSVVKCRETDWNCVPSGFWGDTGINSIWFSNNELVPPSSCQSSRKQNRCWWTGEERFSPITGDCDGL